MTRRRRRRIARFPTVSAAILLLVVAAGSIGWAIYRPDKTIRVVTGMTAHLLCSETFVTGLTPTGVYTQTIMPNRGIRLVTRHMRYAVDQEKHDVIVSFAGLLASHAIYRDGIGCLLVEGSGPVDAGQPPATPPAPPLLPPIAGPSVVEPDSPVLRAALDRFFIERTQPPHRWIKAVVIVHDGRVIAERYAPGIGIATPLMGYSEGKSIINALVGILVRQGHLAVDAPAPIAAWRNPDDPRHRITLDNLLRMTSGLAIAQTGSGFDPASRMLFTERDMAGYVEAASLDRPPGTAMEYSDASALIVSQIVRNAAGGYRCRVQAFARRELFDPLGMRHVVMEMDATGTPVGSTFILASARDWARLGLLYLDDGMAGGQRILPEGWVRYVSSSTLGTSYGAGFWTNAGEDAGARGRIRGGEPCDTIFASGNLGQRIYIIPSSHLVIVRLAVTQQQPDFDMARRQPADPDGAGGAWSGT